VYAVGKFTIIGGQQRKYVAAIDNIGNATAFNANMYNGYVDVVAVRNNRVYISGDFGAAGGQPLFYFAVLDANSGQATSGNPGSIYHVNSITFNANGSTVYLGGNFTQVNGVPRQYVAAIDASTGALTSWAPNVSGGEIATIAISGNTAYIGGGFKVIGGIGRNNLAAFDITTGLPTAWNPSTNAFVAAMAKSGNTLYVGGAFNAVNGQQRTLLAGVDMTTGTVTPFNHVIYSLDVGDRVDAIAIGNNTLYIGGYFNNIDDFDERNRLAAFDLTTGQLTSWNANLDYSRIVGSTNIYAMAVAGNVVYVSGYLLGVMGGPPRNGLAAFDATTGQLTPWAPLPSGGSPAGRVYDIVVSPDASTVYVGGTFTSIGGQARYGLAAISAATGQATTWNPNPDGQTNTMLLNGNTMYVGGSFTSIGGQSHGFLAAVDANTGSVSSWNPNLSNSGSINTLASAGGIVYVGGGDLRINNQPFGSLVALADPTILPLQLTGFTATKLANTGTLSWQVAQEENIATYTVERSADGRSFTALGSVASLGNTTSSRTYRYTDVQPVKGANYYRLKITEKDGRVSYSDIRLLNFGDKISIAVYPNPAKSNATLTGVEVGMSIRLLNMTGQVVVSQKAAGNTVNLPLSLLPAGRYQVQVLSAGGQPISSTNLVKE
jgi:predicted small secreted protein